MSECTKNVSRVYPEGHKRLFRCNPADGLRDQTARVLDKAIARNRKELGYGG